MPPVEEVSDVHTHSVLVRGCISELRYPRMCASRQCRRHKRCADLADGAPVCVASLHPIDYDRLVQLARLVVAIVDGRYPPKPSGDPVILDREDEALEVLFHCLDALPDHEDRILAWHERYTAPPQAAAVPRPVAPSAPPPDAGKLLAGVKAELARMRMLDETRAETEALRQRLAASPGGKG